MSNFSQHVWEGVVFLTIELKVEDVATSDAPKPLIVSYDDGVIFFFIFFWTPPPPFSNVRWQNLKSF